MSILKQFSILFILISVNHFSIAQALTQSVNPDSTQTDSIKITFINASKILFDGMTCKVGTQKINIDTLSPSDSSRVFKVKNNNIRSIAVFFEGKRFFKPNIGGIALDICGFGRVYKTKGEIFVTVYLERKRNKWLLSHSKVANYD